MGYFILVFDFYFFVQTYSVALLYCYFFSLCVTKRIQVKNPEEHQGSCHLMKNPTLCQPPLLLCSCNHPTPSFFVLFYFAGVIFL